MAVNASRSLLPDCRYIERYFATGEEIINIAVALVFFLLKMGLNMKVHLLYILIRPPAKPGNRLQAAFINMNTPVIISTF